MNPKGPAAKWREKPARTNTGGSIRGKTISQPIPFPDDDEFPIRTPGAGIALPLGPEALEREMRLRTSMATEELHPSQPPQRVDPEPVAHTTTFATDRSLNADQRRNNAPSTLRNSVGESVIPAVSSVGRPERKKSSFKSALGRLFGKKKKKANPPVNQANTNCPRNGHRSDPSALNRHHPEQGSASKRSASLPINEFNLALRSHSIVAGDIPQSVRSSLANRDSVQSTKQRTRRATTPSRLWTPNKTPGYVDWTGLSPRPASTHARGSAIISDAEARQIGTAVTSGTGSSHPNRRSRSMGEMRKIAGVTRRRSDEIKYWRESYDATMLSPISSHKADEPILIDEDATRDIPPQQQPQPFNFGPMGALTGMKITEVASLETRVQRLEDRMMNMERGNQRSVATHSAQNTPIRSGRKSSIPRPKTKDSESSVAINSRFREQQEQMYLQEPVPHIYSRRRSTVNSQNNSYYPFDDPENQRQLPTETTPIRPLSTSTTIRGLPSSPSRSRDGPLTAEHFSTLQNLIASEQSARQNLEALVISLQDQIRSLQSPRISALNENLDPNSAFSTFERHDSEDDFARGFGGGGEDEEEGEEVFETPMEIGGGKRFGDECFGGGGVMGNSNGDGTPRTLSLSQITMGKAGQYAGMNF